MIHTISESSQRQTIMEDQVLEYAIIQAKHVSLLQKSLSNTKDVVKQVQWKLMTTACQREYHTTRADIVGGEVEARRKFTNAWSSHLPTAAAVSNAPAAIEHQRAPPLDSHGFTLLLDTGYLSNESLRSWGLTDRPNIISTLMLLLQHHCPKSTVHIRNTHTNSSERLLYNSSLSSSSGLPDLQSSSDDESDEPTQSVISAPAWCPNC